jgi:hypothetical protein
MSDYDERVQNTLIRDEVENRRSDQNRMLIVLLYYELGAVAKGVLVFFQGSE